KLIQVANTFIDNTSVGLNANHEAIIRFNGGATLLTDFTSDTAVLHATLASYPLVPETRFTPALQLAGTTFAGPLARPGFDKVLVFVSDGAVDTPPDSPAAAIVAAQILKNAGVAIYTILIMDPTDPDFAVASNTMQTMAGGGGT